MPTAAARDAHRQPAGGFDSTRDDARDGARALFPGEERLQDGCAAIGQAVQRVGAAGQDGEHGGRTSGKDSGGELGLASGKVQRLRVATLAGSPTAEHAGTVTDGKDAYPG